MATIDFGSTVDVSTSIDTMPELHTLMTQSTTADAKITFNWWNGANTGGEWKKLFAYKTDSSDLTDASNVDVAMDVCSNRFYNKNFLSQEKGGDVPDASYAYQIFSDQKLLLGNTSVSESAAREYVRFLANEIFGKDNMADLFQNEAELVTSAQNAHTTALTNVRTQLDSAPATVQLNSNPLWLVMTALLNDASGTRFDNSGETHDVVASSDVTNDFFTLDSHNGSGPVHYMPLRHDDVLIFKVTFDAISAGGGSGQHGIGQNDVQTRSYKVEITLKDPDVQ